MLKSTGGFGKNKQLCYLCARSCPWPWGYSSEHKEKAMHIKKPNIHSVKKGLLEKMKINPCSVPHQKLNYGPDLGLNCERQNFIFFTRTSRQISS